MRQNTARSYPLATTPTAERPATGLDATTAQRLLHRLLSEAGLRTYRIEPQTGGGSWKIVAIHCTVEGNWRPYCAQVGARELQQALDDRLACRRLVWRLATRLSPCDGSAGS